LEDFAPSSLEGMLEAMATAKKGPVDLTAFVGIKLKSQMSSWAQKMETASGDLQSMQQYNLDAKEKKILRIVDFFEFDAGMVKTFAHWYMLHTEADGLASKYTPRSGLFIDLDMWELNFLQQPTSWTVEDKGGGPRGYHDAVYILKCLNPLGQGYVKTDTDS